MSNDLQKAAAIRKKTVYGLRLRFNNSDEWSEIYWYKSKPVRDGG